MPGPLSTNAKLDQFGFAQVLRDIEMLYLLTGRSPGDMSQTQAVGAGSLGLATGVYNPAAVEVGPDGNIVSISNGAGFSGLPAAFLMGSTYPLRTSVTAIISGTAYPFGIITDPFTSFGGFPSLSYAGAGSTSNLTGFDTAKRYLCTISFCIDQAPAAGSYITQDVVLSQMGITSGGGTLGGQSHRLWYPSGFFDIPTVSRYSHSFVFTGISSLYWSILLSVSFDSAPAAGVHQSNLTLPSISFVQLN
jgi:hypothetical protein